MYARVTVGGLDRLRVTIAARRAALADPTVPLEAAGALTRDAAVRRFAIGGDPAWTPSKKSQTITIPTKAGGFLAITGSGGQTGVDTGNLMRSISVEPVIGSAVRIGTSVPYAKWYQNGSGIFAVPDPHSAWTIKPTHARILAWSFGGRSFLAREVTIRGQVPRPFLYFDDPLVEAIVARFKLDLLNA